MSLLTLEQVAAAQQANRGILFGLTSQFIEGNRWLAALHLTSDQVDPGGNPGAALSRRRAPGVVRAAGCHRQADDGKSAIVRSSGA
jgi:hypothetical protein